MSLMEYPYTLRRSKRSRRIRLSVRSDGSILVTAPPRATVRLIEQFVSQQSEWIAAAIERVLQKQKDSLSLWPSGAPGPYAKHKEEALALLKERTAHFAAILGYTPTAIRVRDQKTRWGSCSRRGSLSFSYRLLFLPENLRDYIVVHELCHLKEFNHSSRFWALVAHVIPEYKALRSELRKYDLRMD